jgi:ATPase family associated with various cellular activities (AAA)
MMLKRALYCLLCWQCSCFVSPYAGSRKLSHLSINSDPQSPNTNVLPSGTVPVAGGTAEDDRNVAYVESLLQNLVTLLDKWILTGSSSTKQGAYNVLDQIIRHARNQTQVELAKRRIQRAGLPLEQFQAEGLERKELGRTDAETRRQEAEQRQIWESSRSEDANSAILSSGKSAFSRRAQIADRADLPNGRDLNSGLDPLQKAVSDTVELKQVVSRAGDTDVPWNDAQDGDAEKAASHRVSELVARAGARSAFEGQALGIGGLDAVLSQIKRRVWIPLAAPPLLLDELGITPVRGLLLYGKPGCGKTLLARKLGQILSPLRYVAGYEQRVAFVRRHTALISVRVDVNC